MPQCLHIYAATTVEVRWCMRWMWSLSQAYRSPWDSIGTMGKYYIDKEVIDLKHGGLKIHNWIFYHLLVQMQQKWEF